MKVLIVVFIISEKGKKKEIRYIKYRSDLNYERKLVCKFFVKKKIY